MMFGRYNPYMITVHVFTWWLVVMPPDTLPGPCHVWTLLMCAETVNLIYLSLLCYVVVNKDIK